MGRPCQIAVLFIKVTENRYMFMRPETRVSRIALVAAAGLVLAAIPALSQDRPESILPPGFGDAPEAPAARRPEPEAPRPRPGADARPSDTAATASSPAISGADPQSAAITDDEKMGEEDAETPTLLVDIPAQVRRSTGTVGLLGASDGDMGVNAFLGINGRYLEKVIQKMDAPIASRWASIVLRRALLSKARTPVGLDGADWVAARAGLLVRMGEANSARTLVQAVDVDQYTPGLYGAAMQAALASSDPAALCPMTAGIDVSNKETSWTLSRAICSAFSGESSLSSAHLDRARSRKGDNDPDVILAEKVVGAASNTRRAVTVNWDEIDAINTWRFGMATATGLEIPERLMQNLNPRMRAWRAQAPLLSFASRLPDAERAAALGILSSSAIVDFYGAAYDEMDSSERGGKPSDLFRQAFIGESPRDRVNGMSQFWSMEALGEWQTYARLVATARLAVLIRPDEDFFEEAPRLIASMLSAGLDRQAMAWAPLVTSNGLSQAWGYLAVGAPQPLGDVSADEIEDFGSAGGNNADLRAKFLFAGLAGLGRIRGGSVSSMAEQFEVPVGRRSDWSDALDEAVRRKSVGAVAILCAVGLQSSRWEDIPPAHLYRVVSALRRVGLEPEARMIAVESLTRV